jgi:phosphoenolpyruvate carboxykinase (GTP)
MNIDKTILDEQNLKKLEGLNNPKVMEVVEKYIKHCKPAKVTVITDSQEDIDYVRDLSKKNGEERELAIEGHTIHFDGMKDQARDKANTKVLLPEGKQVSKFINSTERESGLNEVLGFMDGVMEGKEMLVCFFCLGPNNSKFSIPALQMTDSAYVGHSETILFRPGYEDFKRLDGSSDFFHFVHSAGKVDDRKNTIEVDKRRIYIDLEENRVFTVNNQYAGNSVGLKKLALRLAINKANAEDWLCEHMFVMGVHPPGKNRVTYFTGAFPSACGKTATAMVDGQTIVGDDIAYLKIGDEGKAYAVNVEQGIFGIIKDVNPVDDPVIYNTITTPRELIVSNVLIVNGEPFWLGMGNDLPEKGENFSGEWFKGKNVDGNEVGPAHKNARYTIRISDLKNADPNRDDPNGVPVGGVIYGGRDSDTTIPVFESLSWSHGVYVGAIVESETTSAALGAEGVRKHNPMANLDFLVVPLGLYIKNHIAFGDRLDSVPKIFHTNYFLKGSDGNYLNSKLDKKVWLIWMECRVNNEFDAIETPIGYIPKYEDLKELFRQVFDKEYTKEEYEQQFSIRVVKSLAKLDRMQTVFDAEEGIPGSFFEHMNSERARLEKAKEKGEVISPFDF